MKILLLTLSIVLISGCTQEEISPDEQSSRNKAEAKRIAENYLTEEKVAYVCIDGVMYIFFKGYRVASMTVKFNSDSTVVTCDS